MRSWKLIGGALALLIAVSGCSPDPEVIVVGENWKQVHDLQSSDKSFTVQVNSKKKLTVGDALELNVTSAKDGRLWIVKVDPDDQVDVLFPNSYSRDNSIKAYQPLTIPPRNSDYTIAAAEPAGHSTLACIVTTGPTELGDVFANQGFSSKALTILKQSPEWGIGKTIIDVTSK